MSTMEANIALLSTFPEEIQQQIYLYLTSNFCKDNPYKPLSADEIYKELEESRECYQRGEYDDFDDALDEIGAKHGL